MVPQHVGFLQLFCRQANDEVDQLADPSRSIQVLRCAVDVAGGGGIRWCLWLLYFATLSKAWTSPRIFFAPSRLENVSKLAAEFNVPVQHNREDVCRAAAGSCDPGVAAQSVLI